MKRPISRRKRGRLEIGFFCTGEESGEEFHEGGVFRFGQSSFQSILHDLNEFHVGQQLIFVLIEESENHVDQMFVQIHFIDDLRHMPKDLLVDRTSGDVIEGQCHVDVVNVPQEIVEVSIIIEGDPFGLAGIAQWIGFLDSFEHLLHSLVRETRVGQERDAEVQFTHSLLVRGTFPRPVELQMQNLVLQLFVELQELLDREQLVEIRSEEVLIDDGVLSEDVAGGGVIAMPLADARLSANQSLQLRELVEVEGAIAIGVEHLKGDLKVATRRGENGH